jgi:hypothetical protein
MFDVEAPPVSHQHNRRRLRLQDSREVGSGALW